TSAEKTAALQSPMRSRCWQVPRCPSLDASAEPSPQPPSACGQSGRLLLRRKFVTEFRGASGSQGHNFVRKMDRVVRFFRVSQSAHAFGDDILQIGLPRINYIIDGRRTTKMRRPCLSCSSSRRPQFMPSRRVWPAAIMKIFAEQTKFPELISDIFSDIRYRAIRTHDNFRLILFVGFFASRRAPMIPRHDPAAGRLARLGKLNRATGLEFFESGIPEM